MRFNKINLVFIIQVLDFYLITVYVSASSNSDPIDACITIDGGAGECVPVNQCIYITERFYMKHHSIGSMRCNGRNIVQPAVCCPLNYIERITPTALNSHDCQPSAKPPTPQSHCCGLASHIALSKSFDSTADIDQNPWLVVIGHEKNGRISYLCSGALISSQYILTAAHCVLGPVQKIGEPKTVLLGKYNIENANRDCITPEGGGIDCNDPVVIAIESILVHPYYNPSDKLRRHDIALIKLSQLAPYTEFIRPVCLPSSAITTSVNLTSAGWGTINAPHFSSEVVQTAELPFVRRSDCQNYYNVDLWQGQICAGGRPGKDSCIGDSGGPLVYWNGATNANELVGIYSFGPRPCALEEIPLVFTNVLIYTPWIRFHIRTTCTTTKGEGGQCVDINKCDEVTTDIIHTGPHQFSSRECIEKGLPHTVCCADQCSRSEGDGICSDIYRCPSVQDPNVSTQSNMSRCDGPEPYRICCKSSEPDAPSTINPIVPEESDCILTNEPPPSDSHCCGQEILSEKISGGGAAEPGQYPWLALVIFPSKHCGGALISGKFVLTAAHCFGDAVPTLVRLGEHDLACDELQEENASAKCSSNAVDFDIKKTTIHPNYNLIDKRQRNDIALIELEEMIIYTDYIRPICLPSYDISKNSSTAQLFVSGWGYKNETTKEFPNIKQYIELPYIPKEVCQNRYAHTKNGSIELDNTQICAGGIIGEDSCSGDSGGPLMNLVVNKYEVVGLVSFGQMPCGNKSVPGVYTKVYDYLGWIYDVINNRDGPNSRGH